MTKQTNYFPIILKMFLHYLASSCHGRHSGGIISTRYSYSFHTIWKFSSIYSALNIFANVLFLFHISVFILIQTTGALTITFWSFLKVKFSPIRGMAAYRRGKVTAPLILNLGMRWRCVVNFKPRPLYPRERSPVLADRYNTINLPVFVEFVMNITSSLSRGAL